MAVAPWAFVHPQGSMADEICRARTREEEAVLEPMRPPEMYVALALPAFGHRMHLGGAQSSNNGEETRQVMEECLHAPLEKTDRAVASSKPGRTLDDHECGVASFLLRSARLKTESILRAGLRIVPDQRYVTLSEGNSDESKSCALLPNPDQNKRNCCFLARQQLSILLGRI